MRRVLLILIALITLFAYAGGALAVNPDEMLKDPKLEARARALSEEIRCLVCQNQSIEESDADLAHDLRVLVRNRITAGDTDQQVRDYVVDRYGEFVLLKPVFAWHTLLLWIAAPLVFVGGLIWLVLRARRNRPPPADGTGPELTQAEAEALQSLRKD